MIEYKYKVINYYPSDDLIGIIEYRRINLYFFVINLRPIKYSLFTTLMNVSNGEFKMRDWMANGKSIGLFSDKAKKLDSLMASHIQSLEA